MIINVHKNRTIENDRTCLLIRPGRGDCEHFIGLPEVEDENTTDEYGRPHGWCEVCWRGEKLKRLELAFFKMASNYGGNQFALEAMTKATRKYK